MGTGELSGKPEEMLGGGGGGRLPINRLAPHLGGEERREEYSL